MAYKTTDPQNEELILVDENNKILGKIKRGTAHKTPGIIYRTIYVLIKNNKNEILLQKRSPTKDLYPGCWDLSVGGHVNWGKSYEETAVRELDEEMGLKVKESDLIFIGDVLVKLPGPGEYFRVFEYNLKKDRNISAAKDEVSDTKWMSIEDIKKSMSGKSLKWYPRPEQTISALY